MMGSKPSTLVADLWSAYQQRAYGHQLVVGSEQYHECKRAYYAGAFDLVTSLADIMDEDLGVNTLQGAQVEIAEFFNAETLVQNAMQGKH